MTWVPQTISLKVPYTEVRLTHTPFDRSAPQVRVSGQEMMG